MERDFREGTKGGLGAKDGPYTVDLFLQGKMSGGGCCGYFCGVTLSAALLQMIRVCGTGDEVGMGQIPFVCLVIALVAVGAGEAVRSIKFHGVAALAADRGTSSVRGFGGGGCLLGLAVSAAVKKQDNQGTENNGQSAE